MSRRIRLPHPGSPPPAPSSALPPRMHSIALFVSRILVLIPRRNELSRQGVKPTEMHLMNNLAKGGFTKSK